MNFLSYLINGISLGSVYAIIALGYTMVYGIAKMLNFALKSLGIHKGFLQLFALNSPHVCETSVIFFVFRYTSLL